MAIYCCVNGCHNNSRMRKNDPNSVVSFHAFPRNQELKTKWLKAIGRPNWEPPPHVRVCGVHFDVECVSGEGTRTRIKEDAIPVHGLPPNSNFEATDVKTCRICLATDVKMINLEDELLSNCMDSLPGFDDSIEGMPQYVCYECIAVLMKYYKLVQKSLVAQATLLDIFTEYGEINEDHIKHINRSKLNLTSSLDYGQINVYCYKYVEDDPTSFDTKTDSINFIDSNDIYYKSDIENNEVYFKTEYEDNDNHLKDDNDANDIDIEFVIDNDELEMDEEESDSTVIDEKYIVDNDKAEVDEVESDTSVRDGSFFRDVDEEADEEGADDEEADEEKPNKEQDLDDLNDNIQNTPVAESFSDNDINEIEVEKIRYSTYKGLKLMIQDRVVKKKTNNKVSGLSPDEMELLEFFHIVKLSLQEQKEQWQKAIHKTNLSGDRIYECEVCSKLFTQAHTYNIHVTKHSPSVGKFECPVCKLRFVSEALEKFHRNRTHAKKFKCKICPKTFGNIAMAKQHQLWHSGYRYKCRWCPFSSGHQAALAAHSRRAHVHAQSPACAVCGRTCISRKGLLLHVATAHGPSQEIEQWQTHRCEECDINFASESAKRVHLMTSSKHKNIADKVDLKTICNKCGVECASYRDLVNHSRAEHPNFTNKKRWRQQDTYPTECVHCGETMSCRRDHWHHVRKVHPKEKGTYRAYITSVCDICGKGFSNTTRLQLHKLRHGAPSVPCSLCARTFYDKYALARHVAVHAPDKPHCCPVCGRAFKLKSNMERHRKVHSDVATYECPYCGKMLKYSSSLSLHIRTVHYKMPHPPRKKRTKPAKITYYV